MGGGDVVGPAGATDNAIPRYDGVTGKLIQNSSVLITDLGSINLSGSSAAYEIVGKTVLFASDVTFTTLVGIGAGGTPVAAGFRNTAVGYQAMLNIASGNEHTAVGYQAMLGINDGFFCVAVGFQALFNAVLS